MNEKIRMAINKSKGMIIIVAIMWIVSILVFVGPLTVAIDAHSHGINFLKTFISNLKQPIDALGLAFSTDVGLYFKTLLEFTVVFFIVMLIGFFKAIPKSEYENIEYGSSGWCEGGEQYRVLSPKKGIILAEKNYLPLDKLGNTNVLVIRRFWCR